HAPTEIYTLSLHDALPICLVAHVRDRVDLDQHSGHLMQVAADRGPRRIRRREPLPVRRVVAAEQICVAKMHADLDHVGQRRTLRSEEHTSELQSLTNLLCP